MDYCENKVKAEQRRIIGESRFEEKEKEIPMRGLLLMLIERNLRIPE